MRVLVVDDDPTSVRVLAMLCAARHHAVEEAPDAATAWSKFVEDPPQLILLDWLMPDTDGVSLCRKVRAHPGGDRPVILMITAQNQPEHLQQMLDAGADDYLPKPVDPAHFSVRMTIAEVRAAQRAAYEKAAAELAQRRADQLRLGADIQRTFLLGQVPAGFPGVQIAASAAPAQEVSGDFYDFWPYPEQSALDVVVGDVVGKGVPASLLGAAVKTQLVRALGELALVSRRAPAPAEIVMRVRSAMHEALRGVSQYFTLVLARVDLAAATLTYVNCGHPSILALRAGATACEYLPGHDSPVGFLEEPLTPHTVAAHPGDLFVLYSDGVTEARKGGGWYGEMFGDDRFAAHLLSHRTRPVEEILAHLQSAVAAHAAPAAPGDDVTIVVVRVGGR